MSHTDIMSLLHMSMKLHSGPNLPMLGNTTGRLSRARERRTTTRLMESGDQASVTSQKVTFSMISSTSHSTTWQSHTTNLEPTDHSLVPLTTVATLSTMVLDTHMVTDSNITETTGRLATDITALNTDSATIHTDLATMSTDLA